LQVLEGTGTLTAAYLADTENGLRALQQKNTTTRTTESQVGLVSWEVFSSNFASFWKKRKFNHAEVIEFLKPSLDG
jgi:hypothetical protein